MCIKALAKISPTEFSRRNQINNNAMQAVKYVFIATLVISATQCQAAEFPISADKVDLRLFVENGAAIAKNMFKAVNAGLDQSKPNMDKILNELAPEARTLIRKAIDEARAKMNEEEKRISQIFFILTKALDNLKPVKPCWDKVSPAAKKLALATEKDLANIVIGVQNKYKKEIENIKLGTEKTIQKARKLFDTEVDAVVKCLTPGRKDANACLNKEIEKIMAGISDVVTDIVILAQTANDTLSPILPEMLQKLLPLLEKTMKEGRALMKTLADCVAALK